MCNKSGAMSLQAGCLCSAQLGLDLLHCLLLHTLVFISTALDSVESVLATQAQHHQAVYTQAFYKASRLAKVTYDCMPQHSMLRCTGHLIMFLRRLCFCSGQQALPGIYRNTL